MIVRTAAEMQALGERLARERTTPVFELVGDVGAGKTTLTAGLAHGLGVSQEITSPSFTIAKEYAFPGGRLVHYDFYRLSDPGVLKDELAENLADPTAVIVIEWAETVADSLPASRQTIRLKHRADGSREVEL